MPCSSRFVLSLVIPLGLALAGFAQSSGGGCLSFDGVNDFVNVGRTAALEPGEITIELWARLDGPQDWNTRLLRKGEVDAYFLTADQDLDARMQIMATRGTQFRASATDPQPHTLYNGQWHHFAGVWATDHAEFFVDGVRVASPPHSLGALVHNPPTDLCIGAGLPVTLQNEYFRGRIDEVRIWNHPRTQTEIANSWNRSLAGPQSGLVAYWRFDDGSGQVASDSSGLGHHGRLGWTNSTEASDPTWESAGAPLDSDSGLGVSYCTSTLNSSGAMATLRLSGSLSISTANALLEVHAAPAAHTGQFLFGLRRTRIPFGDGYLCILPFAPGLQRLGSLHAVDATGFTSQSIDFAGNTAIGPITAGRSWFYQFWFRDNLSGGSGSNLSGAIEVTCLP